MILPSCCVRSFWGVDIPARIYPWALLLILQLLMPAVSLLVHASGLIAGYACECVVYVRACLCIPVNLGAFVWP